jgi:hypothetical protein
VSGELRPEGRAKTAQEEQFRLDLVGFPTLDEAAAGRALAGVFGIPEAKGLEYVRKAPGPVIRRGSQALIERWAEVLRGIGAEVRIESFEPSGSYRKVEAGKAEGLRPSDPGKPPPSPLRPPASVDRVRGEVSDGGGEPLVVEEEKVVAGVDAAPVGQAQGPPEPPPPPKAAAGPPKTAGGLPSAGDAGERRSSKADDGDAGGRYWSTIEGVHVYNRQDEAVDLERLDRLTTAEFFPALPERREPRRAARRKWLLKKREAAPPLQVQSEAVEVAPAPARRLTRERALVATSLLVVTIVLIAKLYTPSVGMVHETGRGTYSTQAPSGFKPARRSEGTFLTPLGELPYRSWQSRQTADVDRQAFLFFAYLALPAEGTGGLSPVEVLEDAMHATALHFSAQLETARPVAHADGSGLEAGFTSFRYQRQFEGRMRAYVFGEDVLVLLCEGHSGVCAEGGRGDDFFTSFRVRRRS